MAKKSEQKASFEQMAQNILALEVELRINKLGGYGPSGEVIYEAHPANCPSVLVDKKGTATASFMSNGSVGLVVKIPEGMDISVLDTSFDNVEKREIKPLSGNVWLDFAAGRERHIASLINPKIGMNAEASKVKVVKVGDPNRAMWYCAWFKPETGVELQTVVRMALVLTPQGPALTRDVYVKNVGKKAAKGNLWTNFFTHCTQRFVYNKEAWYDRGLPVTNTESVNSATVPYTDIIQLKRISSAATNAKAVDSTCDYATFIGDTSVFAAMPEAVVKGAMLPGGAGKQLNRFSTASVAANQFKYSLAPRKTMTVNQALLYVTDKVVLDAFRKNSDYKFPSYVDMCKAYLKASQELLKTTPGAKQISAVSVAKAAKEEAPVFELRFPAARAISEYSNSVWMGVQELYEVCRAQGAKLAQGIELGTRDRGQDMWPKMKEDPGIVRTDLVYVMGLMYRTTNANLDNVQSLTLPQKLHGMFPRQYPSKWDNRKEAVFNDNRPYTDSPLWLLNSINMYIRETGDHSILFEEVSTVKLTDPEHPEQSGIIGNDERMPMAKVMLEVLDCFKRHVKDTPYHVAQILYGDWCDPIDMYGSSVIGDPKTRSRGKGVQIRLSAHLFYALVETIDTLTTKKVAGTVAQLGLTQRVEALKKFASDLRKQIVKVAWEDGPKGFKSGFVNVIHELKKDGSRPDYEKGELGYTLGSMKGTDFDGACRRELATQAWCLDMLNTKRPYLEPVPGTDEMIRKVLETVDTMCFNKKLGLVMFTTPIANNKESIAYVGRMGMVPAGTAENGEYHHCQVFMHTFRLNVPGQADTVWKQFSPILSVTRDESVAGPFETPCNCYASDKDDPHFGKGMYFGLSGQVDWLVEIYHKFAGVELNLHDDSKPALRITPRLPQALDEQLTFKRVIHKAEGKGVYRKIPLTVEISKQGKGPLKKTVVKINGKQTDKAEVWNLDGVNELKVEITHVHGA